MAKAKRLAVAVVSVAAAAAVGFTAFRLWKKSDDAKSKGKVFVTQVSQLNTVNGLSLSGSRFSGVIEAQKTDDYKYDSSKTVKSVAVEEGDEVAEGDVLFTYDAEAMQLELDQGKIEVERMENDVETTKLQIEELEKEKKTAQSDAVTSLNMQILSLQSDLARAEYDIKAKKAENEKLEKSIGSCDVTATAAGTVKKVQQPENLEYSESNVLVSISKGGDYLVKGTVNEQMIGSVYEGMPVIIRSRVDDSITWQGTVSSIETSPQSSDNNYYYDEGDSSERSSKYSFYVQPQSLEGLMLGQHIIIEPDLGLDSGIEKKGIWLYSDFVFEEEGVSYVWAQDDDERIEKREVKVGQIDEEFGDCEILSGLSADDFIAYPSPELVEGMAVTTDADDEEIAEQDYTADMEGAGDEYYDDGYYDEGEYYEGEEYDDEYYDEEYDEEFLEEMPEDEDLYAEDILLEGEDEL